MPNTYCPTDDPSLLGWMQNFLTRTAADPAAFSLTESDIEQYGRAVEAYGAAFAVTLNPETRSSLNIAHRRTARREAEVLTQRLVGIVKGVATDGQRAALQITIPRRTNRPGKRPTEPPELDIKSTRGAVVRYRLRGKGSERRGRPEGTAGAMLYTFVGETPPESLSGWRYEGPATKPDAEVDLGGGIEPGAKVWLTAAWVNRRFEAGPVCEPVWTHVAGSGVTWKAGKAA